MLFVVAFVACSTHSAPQLDDVDTFAWKRDRYACQGHRAEMKEALVRQQEKLLGLSENVVFSLLGRPDRNELHEHGRKSYTYYLSPSANCPAGSPDAERLILRFNATGVVQEMQVE